ncbi:calpain-10 isoform X2 [Otolemur garnettii]|uniref:calpain-10 isoform X2 n=1 Tax=Otolemur garnettii TaxID=30611 RepID=UPI0006441D70|nr:calpain-10 isoform X2 [Otolemur garnettii]
MQAGRGETPAPARELFRDAAFPASDSSLFFNSSTPLAQFREDITWRRPQEICATPRLFPDNPWEGQVKQGLLGDCWFLCACAALQKGRHLLDQVFPPGQPSWSDQTYRGSFTCRIWQFGHWIEVTTDDRLPCLAGRLCFSRCQREDVFWLPLLEKVYAKVHGSYEHLWAGQVADALVDLTGGLAERWNLKDLGGTSGKQDGPGGQEHRSCQQLLHLKDQCLISCSVLSPRAGARELGEYHAFLVTDLRELRGQAGQGILLLRIQNPWGRRCWQGLWREGGEGWSLVDPAEESELLSQLQEGEFWVEEKEFLREFDEVTVGYPITEAGHLQSLYTGEVLCHTQALPGAWVKGQSAGGCRNNSTFPSNPKFWLRVSEPSEVHITVLQRPRMRKTDCIGRAWVPAGGHYTSGSPASFLGKDYQAVGLHIWKVEKRRVSLPRVLSAPPVAGTVCHAYDREVQLHCELSPGYYLAVPSTFLKDVPGQFLLRVFSTGKVSLSAVKATSKGTTPGATLPDGEWGTVQLRGFWRAGQTAGGSRNFASYPTNPCLPFSVPDGPSTRCVRITLHQHCQPRGGEIHPIGFHVFQVPVGGGSPGAPPLLLQEPLLSCVPHRYAQEVSQLCLLPAGTYRVVPSTYLPDTEGAFTVTIATRIDRRPIHSQEVLGQFLQEVSVLAVRKT